jgi:peptide deformylase
MAILKIVKYGESSLRQPTKEVVKFSKKIRTLVDDMFDTMYTNNGVGLADPQEAAQPLIFINPKIVRKSGAMNSYEGCLSFPEAYTYVRRYSHVVVKAQNLEGRYFTLESEGETLLTKALQHEFDHLNGVLFIDHARDVEATNEVLEKCNLKDVEVNHLVKEDELEKEILENIKDYSSEVQ